jgi:hypothetical protein
MLYKEYLYFIWSDFMKKKFLLLLGVSFLLSQGLFAQSMQGRQGSNTNRMQNNENTAEVTAQGTVTVTNRRLVELQTADGLVYLMVPHHLLDSIPMKDGDTITAKGYEKNFDDKKVIRVTVITIGNDNYIISGRMGPREMMPRGGRMSMDAGAPEMMN